MRVVRHPEFPLSDKVIYLNHAAVAPWPKRTTEAVKNFAEENVRLGARDYPKWLAKEKELREQLKTLVNAASTDDIALVKNTSEAISFVAMGLDWKNGDNIVSSNEEFPSNRIAWQALAEQGVELRQADISQTDDPEASLLNLVDRNTRMIAVSSIQFASGIRLDLERIGDFCHRRGILFCVDAIQSLGAVEFDAQACRADFVMADGHKWMLGPEGLGVFYSNPEARDQIKPSQYGWHMIEDLNNYDNVPWTIARSSRRFECGSSNMLGIHALSASLSLLLETGIDKVETQLLDNITYLRQLIDDTEQLSIQNKSSDKNRSGIIVFRHKTINNESLFKYIRENGIVCALRGGGIRFSPHFYNAEVDFTRTMEIITECENAIS